MIFFSVIKKGESPFLTPSSSSRRREGKMLTVVPHNESTFRQSSTETFPDDTLLGWIQASEWPTSVFGGDQPALTYSPKLHIKELHLEYMYELRWMSTSLIPLGVWSNLQELRVENCHKLDLFQISQLTQLRSLWLNLVTYPLTGKGNLDVFLHTFTLLEDLNLDWLPRCPIHLPLSLCKLSLSVCSRHDQYELPMELSLLTNLTQLSLSDSNCTGIPFDLGRCYPKLEFLFLALYMWDRAPTFHPLGPHPLSTLELWYDMKDPLPITLTLQLKELCGSCGYFEWRKKLFPDYPSMRTTRSIRTSYQQPPSLLDCASRFVILTLYPTDLTPKIIEVN